MKATKGNKEYSIDENQKKAYQDMGFDIIGDDGEVIAYGRGKTVPYEEYAILKAELDALKADEASDQEESPERGAKKGKAAEQKAGE